MTIKNALVGLGFFITDNFNAMEKLIQAGLGKLAFLIEKIALGDQDKTENLA